MERVRRFGARAHTDIYITLDDGEEGRRRMERVRRFGAHAHTYKYITHTHLSIA
jgi:hypothetical protein